MVLLIDGNSYVGAHVMRYIWYFTGLRHLIEGSHKLDFFLTPKRPIFLHACATFSDLPPNIGTTVGLMEDMNMGTCLKMVSSIPKNPSLTIKIETKSMFLRFK